MSSRCRGAHVACQYLPWPSPQKACLQGMAKAADSWSLLNDMFSLARYAHCEQSEVIQPKVPVATKLESTGTPIQGSYLGSGKGSCRSAAGAAGSAAAARTGAGSHWAGASAQSPCSAGCTAPWMRLVGKAAPGCCLPCSAAETELAQCLPRPRTWHLQPAAVQEPTLGGALPSHDVADRSRSCQHQQAEYKGASVASVRITNAWACASVSYLT